MSPHALCSAVLCVTPPQGCWLPPLPHLLPSLKPFLGGQPSENAFALLREVHPLPPKQTLILKQGPMVTEPKTLLPTPVLQQTDLS